MSYNQDNIFAKIIAGDIPCKKIYESDDILAFEDISKAAKIHILIAPKARYVSFNDFIHTASDEVIVDYYRAIGRITRNIGVERTGYRLITNHGSDGNQTVPHFHTHLLAGEQLEGL